MAVAVARIGLRQPSHSLRHQVSESQQGDPMSLPNVRTGKSVARGQGWGEVCRRDSSSTVFQNCPGNLHLHESG